MWCLCHTLGMSKVRIMLLAKILNGNRKDLPKALGMITFFSIYVFKANEDPSKPCRIYYKPLAGISA